MKPPPLPDQVSPETRAYWSHEGVLYFLAAGQDPFVAVKIGVAAQTLSRDLQSTLRRRMDQIQASNHEPIQLLGLIYYRRTEFEFPMREAEAGERELHNEFQHLARFERDTRGSEWFTSTPTLIARIRAMATPPELLGLPRSFCKLVAKA